MSKFNAKQKNQLSKFYADIAKGIMLGTIFNVVINSELKAITKVILFILGFITTVFFIRFSLYLLERNK